MLSHLGLEGGINEKFQNVDVRWMTLEMSTQCLIDHVLENERIIDGIVLCDVRYFIPAGLSPSGNAGIHDVVGDEEDGLEPFDHPTEYRRVLILRGGEFSLFQYLHATDDRKATCHFPTWDGVGKTCGIVIYELLFEIGGEGGKGLEGR